VFYRDHPWLRRGNEFERIGGWRITSGNPDRPFGRSLFGEHTMARNGYVLAMASLLLLSLFSLASAQTPATCPKCLDTSKMVPIHAYGTVIFFNPVDRAYYYQGKKYAVLNEKNEPVLVPADAPPAENVPASPQAPAPQPGGAGTPATDGGFNPAPATAAVSSNGASAAPAPAAGVATQTSAASASVPQAATPQSGAATQVASSGSATPAPVSALVPQAESPKAQPIKQPTLAEAQAKGTAADVKNPGANLVAIKSPLADQPVNVANAAELTRLNGRWRASVRDFLGNTTVIEMELKDLATDGSATVISQTTGQPPTESERKVTFTDNKLTLSDGAEAQVLGQIAEASTVRLRINGATGEMLFTRSPAD
jgi:hypothetical protein